MVPKEVWSKKFQHFVNPYWEASCEWWSAPACHLHTMNADLQYMKCIEGLYTLLKNHDIEKVEQAQPSKCPCLGPTKTCRFRP